VGSVGYDAAGTALFAYEGLSARHFSIASCTLPMALTASERRLFWMYSLYDGIAIAARIAIAATTIISSINVNPLDFPRMTFSPDSAPA
jgi:hypothetical protein